MPLAASVRVYSTPDGRAAPLRPSILTASTSLVPGSFSVSLGQRLAMRHPASLISISPSPNLELRRTITPHWIPLGGYGVRSPPSPLIERRPCAIYLMSSADCHPPQAGGRDCFQLSDGNQFPRSRSGIQFIAGRDSNPRPSGYEPDELPDCSTPRCGFMLATERGAAADPPSCGGRLRNVYP